MNHKYPIGTEVSAYLCSMPMGRGIIREHTDGNTPRVPMYKVYIPDRDGTYPLYEEEVHPLQPARIA